MNSSCRWPPRTIPYGVGNSMMKLKVIVGSTTTASTLLPRLTLPSASVIQASASDLSRKVREAC